MNQNGHLYSVMLLISHISGCCSINVIAQMTMAYGIHNLMNLFDQNLWSPFFL